MLSAATGRCFTASLLYTLRCAILCSRAIDPDEAGGMQYWPFTQCNFVDCQLLHLTANVHAVTATTASKFTLNMAHAAMATEAF